MEKKNRSAFVDQARTKFVEHRHGRDGEPVRYFEAGEGATPLVVLYTGGIWRSPAAHELLAEDRRVIRIVVPGFIHDYGEIPQEVNSLEEVLEMLGRSLDALDIKTFDLMGSSLAAGFAASLALKCPHTVKALVLVSPAILLAADPQAGKAENPEDLRARFLARDSDVEVPAVTQENLDKLESRVGRLFSPSDRNALEARLPALEMPILVIFGMDDRILPSTDGDDYRAAMPHASVVHVDGAGHVPEVEKPEAFSKLVEDFLAAR